MAITWANILNWESGSLESIAKDLLEANQVLRKAYEDGEDALGAVRSEGEAVTAMRATTLTNLASLERAHQCQRRSLGHRGRTRRGCDRHVTRQLHTCIRCGK